MIATPRLVIAGTHSGVGKTTIATALIAALAKRGLRVQPFKVGPDFIDPGFHNAASGRISRNLDGWMLSQACNRQIFARAAADADIGVVEGVMGLFDGRAAGGEEGSTAEMAKWLRAPVILVADASAMARSAAALVRGFETFDDELVLAGVFFNRVGSERHAALLRDAVGAYCRSKAAGVLPREESIAIPSRHLGLAMANEVLTARRLATMGTWIEQHVDLDLLLGLARENARELDSSFPVPAGDCAPVRIGVAQDEAFCFYYQDNLDLLSAYGAEIVAFSPVSDGQLPPDIGGLYIGGGYPEIHAERLSANSAMRNCIRAFVAAGGAVYAECGGFMYLTESIIDAQGRSWPMAGVFPTAARMRSRLARLGYVEVETCPGERARGHQFRYSDIDPMPESVDRPYTDAYQVRGAIGSYTHLHFLSCPSFARRFVENCARWHERNSDD